jgi:hypothetical protein
VTPVAPIVDRYDRKVRQAMVKRGVREQSTSKRDAPRGGETQPTRIGHNHATRRAKNLDQNPQRPTQPTNFPQQIPKQSQNGAGDGDRTRDVQLGKLAFYR